MRQAMAQATRKAVRASGGRPVAVDNLHVTLAFLGSVQERRLPALAEIARATAPLAAHAAANAPERARNDAADSAELIAGRFAITFDRLEHWPAARLLCALPAEPPAPILAFARRLQERLAAGGFTPDLKSSVSVSASIIKPFRPHVTLARKVQRPPSVREMQPVTWGFTDLVLMDSKTLPGGSVYTVLERFSFAR